MRPLVCILLILLGTCSCSGNKDTEGLDAAGEQSLREEISMLKSENLKKDSLITQSITYFNEIERNLSAIELKEKEIRTQFKELNGQKQDGKEIILQKIRYINDLRLENGRKMYALQLKLDTIDVAEKELKEVLKRLQADIKQKDKEMTSLQRMLEQKDQLYAQLFADYQKQLALNKEQADENNAIAQRMSMVYYVSGSQKELKNKNIVSVVKKGFSKQVRLNNSFNENDFTSAKIEDVKELGFDCKKAALVTDHPASSYQMFSEDGKTTLKILNPEAFWKVSRYLVVVKD